MAADGVSIIDRVYSALVRLRASTSKPAGKIAIHRAMNCHDVAVKQVYEALRSLKRQGRVIVCGYGLFEPKDVDPMDRAFTLTDLPGGRVKLEIGDDLIELTLGELGRIGRYAAGHVMGSGT